MSKEIDTDVDIRSLRMTLYMSREFDSKVDSGLLDVYFMYV